MTKKPQISDLQRKIIEQYELGASVAYLKRKYQLSQSELHDIIPESIDTHESPESNIAGY